MTSQLEPPLRRTVAAGLVLAALCITYLVSLPVGAAPEERQDGPQPLLHRLIDSQALASHQVVTSGDPITYTIILKNSGKDVAIVRVTNHLPPEIVFVGGSAQPVAAYNATARTLSWPDLDVPPQGSTSLTFLAAATTVASPTVVINSAIISTSDGPLQRVAPVLITPESFTPPSHLAGSRTVASHARVDCGKRLTYTISLHSASTGVTYAQVIDNLPAETTYVVGSAQPPAAYDADAKTLSWPRVRVPPKGSASLTFAITATKVSTPTSVINTAIIASGPISLERIARVLFVPQPSEPRSQLAGSQVHASPQVAGAGEVISYTILLNNAGRDEISAQVLDQLPAEVVYIEGSAQPPAAYDEDARTLSWFDVNLPPRRELALTFAATASPVTLPTTAINRAVIATDSGPLERRASVLLLPGSFWPPSSLSSSLKFASHQRIASGDELSYSIRLLNSSPIEVAALVTDYLPAEVSYVAGSAQPAARYDEIGRTLTWTAVSVPARGEITLSFSSVAVQVRAPVVSINRAVIKSGEQSHERHAKVMIVPGAPEPGPRLAGSYKSASRQVAVTGKQFDYTIRVHNSGIGQAEVTVTDPLPAEVNYVPGSSRPEAIYNEGTRTLTWSAVPVPVGGDASLSFGVTGSDVDSPNLVVNSASIAAGGDSLTRSTTVLLVPKPRDTDGIPPMVDSLMIGDQDVLNSPAVTLHISAFDNTSVERMYIREWQWVAEDWPRWKATQSSGWIPYQSRMPWTLGDSDGAHYVGVWVADEAGNRSHLDGRSLDFASLLRPGTRVPPFQPVPYLVQVDAGVEVTAKLVPVSGDSSLCTWYAGALLDPITVASRETKFTTENAGTYLFMVRGQPGATYNLSIKPGGGPRRSPEASPGQDAQAAIGSDALNGEPLDMIRLLAESGLDPLDTADEPGDMQTIYLPVAAR